MSVSVLYSMELPIGVTVTYWRAVQSTMNMNNSTVSVTLNAWVDEAAYLANKEPVTSRVVTSQLSDSTFAQLCTNISAIVQQGLGS